jgi:hypothetical protein
MNIEDYDKFENKTDRPVISNAEMNKAWYQYQIRTIDLHLTEQALLKKEGLIVLLRKHTLKNGRVTRKVVDTGSLEIDGVDGRDAPDFSDAYFSAGQFKDGTDMTDEELNELADEHPDLLHEMIYHHASD